MLSSCDSPKAEVLLCFDVGDEVTNCAQRLCRLVRDLDVENVLDRHTHVDNLQAVCVPPQMFMFKLR